MNKKTRNRIFITTAILVSVTYIYVHYIMGPGKLDFFLRGVYYNEIMETLSSSGYEDIFSVGNVKILFNKTNDCFSNKKYGTPICTEKYNKLFNIANSANFKWASFGGEKGRISHHSIIGGYRQIDYFYDRNGFSEQEKKKPGVQVINDNWIIAHY